MLLFHYLQITLIFVITSIFQQEFNTDVITVTQTMPSSALQGTEFTVELTIKKGSIKSFAKVQQELPPGFTATAIETQQANFSFNNQVVKFIWKSLPEESEFQLSYKVTVSADEVSGIKAISGIFAYLENNERKIVDIPSEEIFIRSSTSLSTDATTETTEAEPVDETALISESQPPSSQEGEESISADSIETQSSGTTSSDNVTPAYIVSSNEAIEEIIENNESLPSGIPSLETEDEGEAIPQGEETTTLTEPAIGSTQDDRLEETVEEKIAENEVIQEAAKEVEELAEFTDETAATLNFEPRTSNPETPSNPVPANITPPIKSSVEFRVQIAASSKKVSNTHFLNKYNISEIIHYEIHNEMNKYTVGSFSNYKSAKEHMSFIRNNKGVEGAFVTAYKNDKRITVHQALEISKQEWKR